MFTPQKKSKQGKPIERRIAFINRIDHVKRYIEITGSGWVESDYVFPDWTGIRGNFGAWAVRIRYDKKHGKLRPKQIEALDRIGFIWDRDDVEKALSLTRVGRLSSGAQVEPLAGDVARDRENSILRAIKVRPDGYPEKVRDVGSAEDADLSFTLLHCDSITRYARSDTDAGLARQNAGKILDRLHGLDLGRIAANDAVIVLWSPPSLFIEVDALFSLWNFHWWHVGYWRKGVLPGHCHTQDTSEYFVVGLRGSPSWGLTHKYGKFLKGYTGGDAEQEDKLIQIFQTGCKGPALDIFGTAPRAGWTVLQEPPETRAGNAGVRTGHAARAVPVPRLATELF